jgi:2-iminobutanoate/2-iminopropanoate deaminase
MKKVIHTDQAPDAVGPYSQAVHAGDLIFTSGQVALDPKTGKMVAGGIEEQARQVLENLKAILEAAGSNLSKVLKATVFLDDISTFAQVNEIYAEYFPEDQPARSAFQVGALPLGALVEIELIALAR